MRRLWLRQSKIGLLRTSYTNRHFRRVRPFDYEDEMTERRILSLHIKTLKVMVYDRRSDRNPKAVIVGSVRT